MKIRVKTKLKKLIKKEDKNLYKILADDRLEANKIYVLGLKSFIERKSKNVKLSQNAIEKLRNMLMDHHENRW